MKRFSCMILVCFLLVFPAYADNLKQIPERPNVNKDYYKYYAIFYNSEYKCYYIFYSTEPYTIGSNNVMVRPDSNVHFYWQPPSESWGQTSRWDSSMNIFGGKSTYLSGNYDFLDSGKNVIAQQSSDIAFTEHAKSNFNVYADYWVIDDEGESNAGLISGLRDVVNAVLSLPTKIVNGIQSFLKTLFIPQEGFIEEKINSLVEKFKSAFGITAFDMSLVFTGSKAVTDIDVSLYGRTMTIVDTSYLTDALDFFRPVIRGFIFLMLFFYNLNQFMGFIGQAPLTLGALIGIKNGKEGEGE